MKDLKVLVHGTGFAGQGHTKAFRDAGAHVVGMVGRTASVVEEVATQMDIPYFGTDWKQALKECQPDIVAIATPGGAHFEPMIDAINFGCHVFSDKPLTSTAESAQQVYQLAIEKGVKTAFASSFRYMPEVQHAKRLVEQGMIGEPTEVECYSHFDLEPHIPFGWSHTQEAGGGRLNNNFTHLLSIVTSVVGESLLSVNGVVRSDMDRAPVVDGVHNFKQRRNFIPQDLNDPNLEWKECDVEWSYTVQAQIDSAFAPTQPVNALFRHGGLTPKFHENYIAFYGTKGAIYIQGHYAQGPLFYKTRGKDWQELATPKDIVDSLPAIDDDTQRNWHYLVNQFVKDISGEKVPPYQTFKEGSLYQALIELIRKNDRWVDVSHLVK